MNRILVMASDSRLASAIASRLAEGISPDTIHVPQHALDKQDHQSLVMVLTDSESIVCSFYSSPFKTQEREKRDALH